MNPGSKALLPPRPPHEPVAARAMATRVFVCMFSSASLGLSCASPCAQLLPSDVISGTSIARRAHRHCVANAPPETHILTHACTRTVRVSPVNTPCPFTPLCGTARTRAPGPTPRRPPCRLFQMRPPTLIHSGVEGACSARGDSSDADLHAETSGLFNQWSSKLRPRFKLSTSPHRHLSAVHATQLN